jgi:tetratricopeptide (TPR) repeat protein
MQQDPASRVLTAIDCLKRGERRRAQRLLADELREGPPSGERWRSICRLAGEIGEIDMAIDASRRHSLTEPISLERMLGHWGVLASLGRTEEALEEAKHVPASVANQPILLHFRGTVAGQLGDFRAAEEFYRRALAQTPYIPQTWFALAMIKTFAPGDSDLAAMEKLLAAFERSDSELRARFFYALGKAHHDCGEFNRAFEYYAQGAALRREAEQFDAAALEHFADGLVRDFTPQAMARLLPSQATDNRVIFVNGLPRSGTTLVEQLLVSHSRVGDGAEVNLLKPALIPTVDRTWAGALAYQKGSDSPDPWGDIAHDYQRMIGMRFHDADGLIVDKTLIQSHMMGLLLHTLPQAKVLWLRRDPQDVALSCFRTFFTSAIPWSWSFADIGRFFRIEDRLYRHWADQFPERILTVPYEGLVQDPGAWVPRILTHAGLEMEPQVMAFHETRRSVRTASVQQVRAPISTDRVGLSAPYAQHMGDFHAAYPA